MSHFAILVLIAEMSEFKKNLFSQMVIRNVDSKQQLDASKRLVRREICKFVSKCDFRVMCKQIIGATGIVKV